MTRLKETVPSISLFDMEKGSMVRSFGQLELPDER